MFLFLLFFWFIFLVSFIFCFFFVSNYFRVYCLEKKLVIRISCIFRVGFSGLFVLDVVYGGLVVMLLCIFF